MADDAKTGRVRDSGEKKIKIPERREVDINDDTERDKETRKILNWVQSAHLC